MKALFAKSSDIVALTAKVSPDGMKLFVDAEPKGKNPITRNDLLALVDPPFAPSELDLGVLDDIALHLSKGEKVTDRRIKKGEPAEPGIDGKLLLLVKKFDGSGELKTDDKGMANFTARHLFDNIAIGQIIGRVYPPKPGKPGRDVTGKTVPASPSKPVKVSFDKTVLAEKRQGEDFDSLVAQQEGFLIEDSGKLSVREEFSITGDLDLRVGSLDCIGKVKISGHVAPGLTVRAKKGVTVQGDIQESVLESPQGDVVVKGFAFGGPRGKIVCGAAVRIRVAQELRIEAMKDITIEKEAVDCVLRTQSQISMPSGKLVGGEVFVVCGLEAKAIGNEAGKRTVVHLCSDVETSTEFTSVESSIASHDQALHLVGVHLGPYATSPARIQLLKEPFKSRMEKMLHKRDEIAASRTKLLTKKKALLDNAHRSETLRVNAKEAFFPGVIIMAGEDRFEVKEIIKGPKTIEYSPKEKKFEVRDIQPIVCTVNFEKGASDGKVGTGS